MRDCWACGHPLSVIAPGILCGRCKGEHRRDGRVRYRRMPQPSRDWPRCEGERGNGERCGVPLNPQYGRRYCLFHSEVSA